MSAPVAIDLRLREILARDVAEFAAEMLGKKPGQQWAFFALWNNRVNRLEDATPGANHWNWGFE